MLLRVHALRARGSALPRDAAPSPPGIAALQLRDHLLHRPAGHELDDDEGDQQHPNSVGIISSMRLTM